MRLAFAIIALVLGISRLTVADFIADVHVVSVDGTDDIPETDDNELLQGDLRVERRAIREFDEQTALQEAITAQNEKIASLEKDCHNSNLELVVQNAVQRAIHVQNDKIATLEKSFSERDGELTSFKMQMAERDEEMKTFKMQMHDKLHQQEMMYKQLLKEHRVSYGMLLQVCEEGLQRVVRSSANGTLLMDVANTRKQKWPKFVKDSVDWTKDAANTVADTVSDVADTVADLPADIGEWSLTQFEHLKSFVGLSWNNIPGLSNALNSVKNWAVDQAEKLVNAAKDYAKRLVDEAKDLAVDAVNAAMDTVKDWVSIIEDQVKKVTDYVSDLYNKYLKPIITMIWDCAKNAKSPQDFVVCVIKPVLSKIMEALVPVGSVSEAVPFPFDDEALLVDPGTGVYTMTQTCFDCQENDMRDLAPLACQKKELDFLSIFKVKAHACNVPFMPGQCGGNMLTCLKKRASQCAKSAILWAPSGVLSKLSEPLNQAMQLSQTCVQKITDWASEARALHEKVKAFESSSKDAVKDISSKIMNAVDSAKNSKDSIVECLKAVGGLASAKTTNSMLTKLQKVISSVEEMIAAIENTEASVEAVQTSFNSAGSSANAEVQEFYNRGITDMQSLQSDIMSVKEDLLELYQDSKGVADDLMEDLQTALAAPIDQLENLGDMLLNCATARESYQRVYVDLELASVTVGRLVLHERDGVQLAHLDPGRSDIYHEQWPWSTLATHEGETVNLCVFIYCVKFKMKLRRNPSNILGLPIQVNAGLEVLKWFELEYHEFSYNLNVIGVPFKFTDPTGIRFPSITLPFLVSTSEPAQDPTNIANNTLNVLWQKIVDNTLEAQQIADGQATAPSLPADAASASAIDQIQSEVDQGVDFEGTAPTISVPASSVSDSDASSCVFPCGYVESGSQCDCGTRIEQWGSGKSTSQACADACNANVNCASFALWVSGHCALFDVPCQSTCTKPTVYSNTAYNKIPSGYSANGEYCDCGTRISQWASGKSTLQACADECTANENCASFGLWNSGHCALFDMTCQQTCSSPTQYANTVFNKLVFVGYSASGSQCDCGTRIEQWGSGKSTLRSCADACTANVNCASFAQWGSGHCALFDVPCLSTCTKPTVYSNIAYNKIPSGYSEIGEYCDCGTRIAQWASGKSTLQACADECTASASCASFGLWSQGHCALYDMACEKTCLKPTQYANTVYNKASGLR